MTAGTILSLRHFAWRIATPVDRLRAIADNITRHYRVSPLRDKRNRAILRMLQVPDDELMAIQRQIVKHVLDPLGYSGLAHGGVRGRSPRSNAAVHLGQPWLVTVDVREFFPSVQHKVVHGMFRDLGFGRDVANLITRLVTYRGYLPQGSPTSTPIANLLLRRTDAVVEALAPTAESQGTRFVDDIALSGKSPVMVVSAVARELSRSALRIHRGLSKSGKPKLKVTPNCARQEVTGLVVNSACGPSVSKLRRDRVRAEIHRLPSCAADLPEKVASLRGKIAHVRQFNPGSAARLEQQLANVLGEKAENPHQR